MFRCLLCITLVAGFVASFTSTATYAAKGASYDAEFLDQMSEHHMSAIKMAALAKEKAANPELRKIAEKMQKDQGEEIAQMKQWRREYFAQTPKTSSKMPKMDMQSLKQKTGRDFDFAFINMMTKHHEQGINMAKAATDKLFQPSIKNFAELVIHKQGRENQDLAELKKLEASDH